MKTLNLYKYLIAALFISVVFTGCSNKSDGIDGINENSTEVGFAGADQNVTVGTPFTVTANSTQGHLDKVHIHLLQQPQVVMGRPRVIRFL